MFRYLILGFLRSGVPHHGYALVKEYRERCGLHIGTGNFYRELQRLAGAGLAQAVANADSVHPRRAPYTITAAGAEVFDRWLAGASRPDVGQYDNETSVRALFITAAHATVVRQSLERCRAELWLRSKELECSRDAVGLRRVDDVQRAVLQLLLARRLNHVAVDVQFLDDLRLVHEQLTARAVTAIQSPARAEEPVRGAGARAAERAGRRRSPSIAAKGRAG